MGVALVAMLWLLAGCEADSWMNPSVVGRWERSPVVLPILEQLDVIDEPQAQPPGLTQVQPGDLTSDVREYVIGPGDLITVTIFELIVPNLESVQTRRVDELGLVRLPIVGAVTVAGLTPSLLEKHISQLLTEKSILKDATVSVIVQEGRQRTFSVIGEPRVAGTAIGTYTILGTDFRLLDAMALARGVPGSIKKLYVIRQTPAAPVALTGARALAMQSPPAKKRQSKVPPSVLLEELLQSPEAPVDAQPAAPVATPPRPEDTPVPWRHVNGKWVRTDQGVVLDTPEEPRGTVTMDARPASQRREPQAPANRQRIIEIPYDKLLEGDLRFNIVIQAGDIIRVPPPVIGNVYIGGAINRPGTFSLPGDKDLTLKQLVFAAGNLSPLAIPQRVDLIRRIGTNQEATVRLNLKAIFDGVQPDFFLRPNDTINVGTNFMATPLAVLRNGMRSTYGFGFVLDRNFGPDVFGAQDITE